LSPRATQAMVLDRARTPLRIEERPIPEPGPGQVLLKVNACGICRTDLHVVDGELTEPKLPLVPGHQIVGVVEAVGMGVSDHRPGDRVGVPWLGWTCGECAYCRSGRENLCDRARFTGYQIDGGFAGCTVADSHFCLPLPVEFPDLEAAPLLCAGLIGYRCLRLAGDGRRLGIYGFGSAAHIVIQVAKHRGQEIFAFTRPGDAAAQRFAADMGADWVGDSGTMPPEPLDAAIIFAPAGELVPIALTAVAKGGVVVCGGIHMSDIPSFQYSILWGERVLRSVANLTRADGHEFLHLAADMKIHTEVQVYPLDRANEALSDLRDGRLRGSGVLSIS
jgi:alcohol dehydrogenase, propanol-preferring